VAYQNASIAETIDALNVTHFLPAIQREFVWGPDRIVMLFDSVLRGYPISSFLYWHLKHENAAAWEFYDFVRRGSARGARNKSAIVTGVPSLTIVLDGQQRLTSLLIGLRGQYEFKKRYGRYDNPDTWQIRRLHLDLLKNPAQLPEDGEEGLRYGLEFLEKRPERNQQHFWIEAGEVLRHDTEQSFEEFRAETLEVIRTTGFDGDTRVPEKNLDRLYHAIWTDKAVAYFVETDQDYDRVLDIFVRANQGAVRLSKSDLLLSMMTARWSHKNARNEVYDFVDRLNMNMPLDNSFDKDFVMKSCLVLSDLPVAYQVRNFNRKNLELIATNWDRIKSALERTVRLVNRFGISRDNLTSANALIPVAYYFMQHPRRKLQGTSQFDDENVPRVHTWVLTSLLNNLFGGQSDRALTVARQAMQSTGDDDDAFPLEGLVESLETAGRRPRFDDVAVEDFLETEYGDWDCFLALSLLYDNANWGHMPHELDHIFPRKMFSKKSFDDLGWSEDRRKRYLDLRDCIGNLQLLTESENRSKSGKDFSKWLSTRSSDFRNTHLIPVNDKLLKFERFEEFVASREELIRARLESLFGIHKGAK
jgi:hypothetical protein